MADAVADGLIRAVGVSNYFVSQTLKAYEALARRHIPLASLQVKYNLLDRHIERNGLVDLCKNLGVTIIAYSPLEKGILTGKYSIGNLPQDFRTWRYNNSYLARIEPIISALREIGEAHASKILAAVALNWLMCQGAVPIPGARNAKQAQENASAMGWRLDDEEVERLNKISDQITRK